jgi:hypothetical protein
MLGPWQIGDCFAPHFPQPSASQAWKLFSDGSGESNAIARKPDGSNRRGTIGLDIPRQIEIIRPFLPLAGYFQFNVHLAA